ncbi:hypothetical protein D9M70_590910 [compost metagenome]
MRNDHVRAIALAFEFQEQAQNFLSMQHRILKRAHIRVSAGMGRTMRLVPEQTHAW